MTLTALGLGVQGLLRVAERGELRLHHVHRPFLRPHQHCGAVDAHLAANMDTTHIVKVRKAVLT